MITTTATTAKELMKKEKQALEYMIKLLDVLQSLDKNMPLNYALMWLLVARSAAEGTTMDSLKVIVGTSKASAERFKEKFTELGLIEVIEDRLETRSFLYKITKKGHIRLNQLQAMTAALQAS
ncbi:MAG: hypothetical protein COC24_004545 [Alphaproteobacteria bacterium]|nr:hypothetical protein [Alphaproteobacteria bacterium]